MKVTLVRNGAITAECWLSYTPDYLVARMDHGEPVMLLAVFSARQLEDESTFPFQAGDQIYRRVRADDAGAFYEECGGVPK